MNTTPNTQDELERLLHEWEELSPGWIDNERNFKWMLGMNNGVEVGPFMGRDVMREGRFLIQAWWCPPNTSVPEHSHPSIDIIQIYVSGQVYLNIEGREVVTQRLLDHEKRLGKSFRGRKIRIRPGQRHSFSVGPEGGIFLSAELWDKEPTSAELDWDGPPIDAEHGKHLPTKLSHRQ